MDVFVGHPVCKKNYPLSYAAISINKALLWSSKSRSNKASFIGFLVTYIRYFEKRIFCCHNDWCHSEGGKRGSNSQWSSTWWQNHSWFVTNDSLGLPAFYKPCTGNTCCVRFNEAISHTAEEIIPDSLAMQGFFIKNLLWNKDIIAFKF